MVAAGVWMLACSAGELRAQGATRDLSTYGGPGSTFTVTITLDLSSSPGVVGMEDAPPAGWLTSSISDGGSFDVIAGKVKWGPYLDPSIPAQLTYDITVPNPLTGGVCFAGAGSFDGQDEPITGDACVIDVVPATSTWGLVVMCLMVAVAGSVLLRLRLAKAARPSRCRCPVRWHQPKRSLGETHRFRS